MGLELTTPRSRVTCSTDWTSQAPPPLATLNNYYHIDKYLSHFWSFFPITDNSAIKILHHLCAQRWMFLLGWCWEAELLDRNICTLSILTDTGKLSSKVAILFIFSLVIYETAWTSLPTFEIIQLEYSLPISWVPKMLSYNLNLYFPVGWEAEHFLEYLLANSQAVPHKYHLLMCFDHFFPLSNCLPLSYSICMTPPYIYNWICAGSFPAAGPSFVLQRQPAQYQGRCDKSTGYRIGEPSRSWSNAGKC